VSIVRLRRHVAWIVGTWLLCQASAMILVPVSLCVGNGASAVEAACTCAHSGVQECPMHHTRTKSPSSCSCRSTTGGPTAILASLLGSIAVLPVAMSVLAATPTSDVSMIRDVFLLNASINPDPPPPRA
jgi:hypothetical protein